MPNQMIALQTRSPQLPDPARIGAQYANMMTMARQQEAAQRQAEQARQEMVAKAAQEARAAETQTATIREKDQAYRDKEFVNLRNIGKDVSSQQGYEEWLGLVEQANPNIANVYRKNVPVWSREAMQQIVATADDFIAKNIAARVANVEVDDQGNIILIQSGGFGGPRVEPAVITNIHGQPSAPPAAAPAASTPSNPMAAGAAPNTAAAEPGSLGLVIASALETGVMSKSDYDKMISIAPPQSRAKIAAWAQQNNIEIAPDTPGVTDNQMRGTPMAYDGQTPESQFAVYRGEPMQSQTAGLRGAPPMEQTLAQYQVGQQVKGKNPNMSPLPGSARVPIERVQQEAQAGRESPAEAAAKAAATARATANVETEKKAAEKLPGRKQVSTLIKKVRGAYEALDKAEAIPSETRGGFANAMDYFASSSLGREAQKMVGTKTSKYLSEIINSRKLLATAIKNATGMSAQEMNSNTELQLMMDALTDPTQGIEAARSTLDTIEELYGAGATAATAAPRPAARTPVIPDAAKQMLRKNPSSQQRAFFDRTFGAGAAAKVLGVR